MGEATEHAGPDLAQLYESQLTRWTGQVQTYRRSVRLYQEAFRLAAQRRSVTTAYITRGVPECQ